MILKIVPTSELALKLNENRVGNLEYLSIDLESGGGFLGIPQVKLGIALQSSAFASNEGLLKSVLARAAKYKFLSVTVYK